MNAFYASGLVLVLALLVIIIMRFFGTGSAQMRKSPETVARDLIKRAGRYMETARNSKNQLLKMLYSNYALSCFKIAQEIYSDEFIQSQCNVDILALVQKAEALNDLSIQAVNRKGKFMKSDNVTVASCFT